MPVFPPSQQAKYWYAWQKRKYRYLLQNTSIYSIPVFLLTYLLLFSTFVNSHCDTKMEPFKQKMSDVTQNRTFVNLAGVIITALRMGM